MPQLFTVKFQEHTIMRTAVTLIACTAALCAMPLVHGQATVVSEPAGFFNIPINPGANSFATPLHQVPTYRGTVASVSGSTVTLSGSPGFGTAVFNQRTLGGKTWTQYILIVTKDDVFNPNNVEGDWWLITGNTANSVNVDHFLTLALSPASLIEVGDTVEIRKLTSVMDLFGATGELMNKSADGVANANDEDVIRTLNGTSFDRTIFYTTLAGGTWIVNGTSATNGSQLTFLPQEPVVFFRKPATPATNVVSLGQVHTKRLTKYLKEGNNTIGMGYPTVAQMNNSAANPTALAKLNLNASGWLSSADGTANPNDEDVIRPLNGVAFGATVFHTSLSGGRWVQSGNTNVFLQPQAGYVFQIKPGDGGIIWRQNAPFDTN
jgi:uncharacterized protein (TIGR02597 family)